MNKLFFLLGLLFISASCFGNGDRLLQTYTKYKPLPFKFEQLQSMGWASYGSSCSRYGFAYTLGGQKPSSKNPTILYFSQSRALSAIGVGVYGKGLPQELVQFGAWTEVSPSEHYVHVMLRSNSSNVCDARNVYPSVVGDVVDLSLSSKGDKRMPLPLTAAAAQEQGWFKGSCFDGMGDHWFYDLAAHPSMSWDSTNLLPIVMMYDQEKGEFNSFFVASTIAQGGIGGARGWEPIPLPNALMCKNLCSSNCTFSGLSFPYVWSTMHFYFRDYTQVPCAGGCKIACCK